MSRSKSTEPSPNTLSTRSFAMQPPTPIETDGPAPKKVSTGVLAGRLYERIKLTHTEEDAEIADAPASIRKRYAEKRKKMLAAAPPEVSTKVALWLKAEEPEAAQ